MASPVTISLGYIPVFSVSPFFEASQCTVISRQYHNAPPRAGCCHPNPDGIEAPAAPLSFAMGGISSAGNFSPLTMSDMMLIHSIQGGSTPRSYILTQRGSSLTANQGSSSSVLPSSGTSVMSSIAGSMVSAASDLSQSATTVATSPPPAPTPSPVTIKDKPSDMGIKNITDKESWTEAKKIIDARLRRAPYWPGKSRALVTTNLNAAASIWWEEVIAYYCKPPVSDLFVEEHRFDDKGFEMIAHINQHFNPSGAVDSPGYIFDLINIKQTKQESIVTLKACFSKAFSAIKMGGIGMDSVL